MRLMGHGRYRTEGYPAGAPPTYGVPDEIIRYYFSLTPSATADTRATMRPWSSAAPSVVQTDPLTPDLLAPLPVPPCQLLNGALILLSSGDSSGSPISLQWRGLTDTTFPPPVPAPAFGAPVASFIDPTVGAGISIQNFDFSDVIIPLGGAVIFPDLAIPSDWSAGSVLEGFFTVGIKWNAGLINEPFGPPSP